MNVHDSSVWTGAVHVTDDIYEWWRWVAPYESLAIDTETTGLQWDATILTIQASGVDEVPYVLDCRGMNHRANGHILETIFSTKELIFHNAKYDLGKFLVNFDILLHKPGTPCRIYDTMIAEQVIHQGLTQPRPKRTKHHEQDSLFTDREWIEYDRYSELDDLAEYGAWAAWLGPRKKSAYAMRLPMGLGPVIERYTGVHLEKGLATSFAHSYGAWTQEQLLYMANDVVYLHRIKRKQEQKAKKWRVQHIIDLENSILMSLAYMEVKGFHIDLEKWTELCTEKQKELIRTRKELQRLLESAYPAVQTTLFDLCDPDEDDADDMAGLSDGIKDPILSSPKKLLKALNRILAGHVVLETTDKNVLKTLTRFPVIDALLNYRTVEQFFKSFANKYPELVDENGNLHPNYIQMVRSGRMACTGPNLQQVPHEPSIRACFTAMPGYKMIVADYSQAELRILADVSQCTNMIESYNKGLDLHILTAVRMINLEHPNPPVVYEDVGKKHPKRLIAKTTGFSVVYQIGPTKLSLRLSGETKTDIPKEEAQTFMDAWFEEFPEAKVWIEKMKKQAERDGYVRTQYGRIRHSGILKDDPDIKDLQNKWSRQAPNTIIQGGNADAAKRALAELWNILPQFGAWVCGLVHDELIVYAPEEHAETVRIIVRDAMERGGDFLRHVRLEAEVAPVGEAWDKP